MLQWCVRKGLFLTVTWETEIAAGKVVQTEIISCSTNNILTLEIFWTLYIWEMATIISISQPSCKVCNYITEIAMSTSLSGPHAVGPVAWVLESWLEAVREWGKGGREDNEAGIWWASLTSTSRNLSLCLRDPRSRSKREKKQKPIFGCMKGGKEPGLNSQEEKSRLKLHRAVFPSTTFAQINLQSVLLIAGRWALSYTDGEQKHYSSKR